ncbi:MAG: hypothetical protein FJX54_14835 [Alphaproteobacteria bacterium]|nr:hypothetical protein [Alphaproteobacteria bacterium]
MSLPRAFLLSAVLFAIVGMSLGIHMGIAHDFTAVPVHAHIILVGWVTLGLYGLVHRAYPAMAESGLAWAQFWIAEAGAIVFPIGIALSIYKEQPLLAIIGSLAVLLGMVLFAVIAFTKLRD